MLRLFTPIPTSPLNILLHKRVTTLYLNKGEFCKCLDSVPVLNRDDNGIASFYSLLLTIEHEDAFAFYESPGLASVVMDLIADVLAFLERNALGEGVSSIGIVAVIKYAICSPTSFLVHRT